MIKMSRGWNCGKYKMKNKILLLSLGILLISTVIAGEITNITPTTFNIPDMKSGDYFQTSFNFDYTNLSGNYNNAPLIIRVNITPENPTPNIWKGDFQLNATIKQYLSPGHIFSRTINLNCSEADSIKLHSANGIDLRYIDYVPNGTFYCYNSNYYFLQLNSKNEISLNVKTNPLIYPGDYNFKIEFLQTEDYAIPLNEKWNLVSFPFPLFNNSVENLTNENSDIESIWTYNNGEWEYYIPGDNSSTLKDIIAGRGYWIKSKDNTFILVGIGNLLKPQTVPPSVNLTKGWNLIGHYGLESKEAYCDLFSLTNESGGPKWSSLYKFDSWNMEFEELNESGSMNPGEGYWIGMENSGIYFPSTICVIPGQIM